MPEANGHRLRAFSPSRRDGGRYPGEGPEQEDAVGVLGAGRVGVGVPGDEGARPDGAGQRNELD